MPPPYYGNKNTHKLYDFVAHGSAVTCLAIGQKSGRVMVTGGDDAKINLWAIGKSNCIMSLNGHKTSIECVKFNYNEDIVGAGSASGAIKLWDLEAAKLIQTLTGHKTNVRCMDFHPYGQFMATGSFDTNIKLWDYRKKGCILTYKAHAKDVHCLRLSPDGRWLASGGHEGTVILYDIVASKMLTELKGHNQLITDVVFHPNEFLLSSSSTDGTVKFWDLEGFQEVSSTHHLGPIRKISFHPDGKALLTGGKDYLRVFGWEPTKQYDLVEVNWGRLSDMSVLDEQLIAGTHSATNVSVYVVDIGGLQPFSDDNRRPICKYSRNNTLRQSTRKSFNFDQTNKTCKQLESLDSNRTEDNDTNTSDGDDSSMAEIINSGDYREIFHSKRQLPRTPPPLENDNQQHRSTPMVDNLPHSYTVSSFTTNGKVGNRLHSSTRNLSESLNSLHLNHRNNNNYHHTTSSVNYHLNQLNNNTTTNGNNILSHASSLNHLNHSKTLESTAKTANTAPPTFPLLNIPKSQQSAYSSKSLSPIATTPSTAKNNNNINHLSTPKITSVVRPVINDSTRPIAQTVHQHKTPSLSSGSSSSSSSSSIYADHTRRTTSTMASTNDTFIIPETRDHSAGLDFNDFLPKHIQQYGYDHQPLMSEMEAIVSIVKGHKAAKAGLDYRRRQVQIVLAMWSTKDSKTALEYAVNLDEKSIVIDILNVMVLKSSSWNLDICLIMLPCIQELLESKYESYMLVGCSALSLILKTFSTMIKNNISAPPGIGVDITREERYNKCMKCYNHLLSARAFVLKRQTLQGKIGRSFRELSLLMQNLE